MRISSGNWYLVDEAVREKMGFKLRDDGEFWMDLKDFLSNFDEVDVCNLTPDSITEGRLRAWNCTILHGAWIRGKSDGGRLKNGIVSAVFVLFKAPSETFATNPQFGIELTDADEESTKEASAVIELTQKNRRPLLMKGLDFLNIGFSAFDVFLPFPALFETLSFRSRKTPLRPSIMPFSPRANVSAEWTSTPIYARSRTESWWNRARTWWCRPRTIRARKGSSACESGPRKIIQRCMHCCCSVNAAVCVCAEVIRMTARLSQS